jgi:hypothetical protein
MGVTSLTNRLLIPVAQMLTPGGATASNVDFQCFPVETIRPKVCGDHRPSMGSNPGCDSGTKQKRHNEAKSVTQSLCQSLTHTKGFI